MSRRRKGGPGRVSRMAPAVHLTQLRPGDVERLVLDDGDDCPWCRMAGIRVEADGSVTDLAEES